MRRVSHRELALKFPKILQQHGWKYIVVPDDMEQNIRGLVIRESRNKYDKKTGMYRYRVEVIPIDSPNKTDWEWVDYYDRLSNKLQNIIVSNGTVLVPLSKRPNKYDYSEDIAWYLLPPEEVNYWKDEVDTANALKEKYSILKNNYNRLSSQYENLSNEHDSTVATLKDMERTYKIKLKSYMEIEAENRRLNELINGIKTQLTVLETNLNELARVAKMNGSDIVEEKIKRTIALEKSIKANLPAEDKSMTPTPAGG